MRQKTITCNIRIYDYDELPQDEKELIDEAKNATTRSYAPYSKFNVAACARLNNGETVTGTNQENAAFPSGLCAERTCLFYANAQFPDQPVKKLAIAAYTNGKFLKSPIPPCGACRQVILGVEDRYKQPIKLLLYGTDGIYTVESVKDILPLQFVADSMNE